MANLTQKAKTLTARLSWKRALIVYSVAVSTLAFILVIALYNANQAAQKQADVDVQQEKARDTLLATYDKLLINEQGDKVLVPELKLALPATTVSRTLLYQYVGPTYASGGTTNPEGAKFASRTAINESTKPNGSDACNILAQLSVGRPLDNLGTLTGAGSVTLSNGQLIYLYENRADCGKVWGSLDGNTTIMLLKQAVHY